MNPNCLSPQRHNSHNIVNCCLPITVKTDSKEAKHRFKPTHILFMDTWHKHVYKLLCSPSIG